RTSAFSTGVIRALCLAPVRGTTRARERRLDERRTFSLLEEPACRPTASASRADPSRCLVDGPTVAAWPLLCSHHHPMGHVTVDAELAGARRARVAFSSIPAVRTPCFL